MKISVDNTETKAIFLHSVKEKVEHIPDPVQEMTNFITDLNSSKESEGRELSRKRHKAKNKVSVLLCDA